MKLLLRSSLLFYEIHTYISWTTISECFSDVRNRHTCYKTKVSIIIVYLIITYYWKLSSIAEQ